MIWSKWYRLLVTGGLVLLVGCGSGPGSQGPTVVGAPTQLKAVWGSGNMHEFLLSWTPGPGKIDCHVVEFQIGSGNFMRYSPGLAPFPMSSKTVWVDRTLIPEAADLNFRLRAAYGLDYSAYSNSAPLHTGIYEPNGIFMVSTMAGVQVHWNNTSKVADEPLVERGTAPDGITVQAWTALAGVPRGASSFLDTQAPEDSTLIYRITYAKGQDRASAESYATHSNLFPPEKLQATPLVEGVRLTWQNRSVQATELVVMRCPRVQGYLSFEEVAHLPTTATSFEDLAVSGGAYTYRVEARKAGKDNAYSDSVEVVPLPAGDSRLAQVPPSILQLPEARAVDRDAAGQWHMVHEGDYSSFLLKLPAGPTWIDRPLPNATYLLNPTLKLDTKGHPHAVYLARATQDSNSYVVVHTWHDGAAWQDEEITRMQPDFTRTSSTFTLDALDRLHMVIRNDLSKGAAFEYWHKGDAGDWARENLQLGQPSRWDQTVKLVVGTDGTPQVGLTGAKPLGQAGYGEIYVLTRQGPAQWLLDRLPDFRVATNYVTTSTELLPSQGGEVSVIFLRANPGSLYEICETRRSNGIWSDPAILGTTKGGNLVNNTLVQTPDLSRAALSINIDEGTLVLIRDHGHWTWSRLPSPPTSSFRPFLGFDTNARLAVLLRADDSMNTPLTHYILYTEGTQAE